MSCADIHPICSFITIEIGIFLTAIGLFFTLLGVLLLFDRGFLAIGNVRPLACPIRDNISAFDSYGHLVLHHKICCWSDVFLV
jgi:hypothetical protein